MPVRRRAGTADLPERTGMASIPRDEIRALSPLPWTRSMGADRGRDSVQREQMVQRRLFRPKGLTDPDLIRWFLDFRTVESPAPYGLPKPCRLWQGAHTSDGYAQAGYRGKVRIVTRIILGLAERDAPIQAAHLCDRSDCIEPTHLERASPLENVRQIQERGRMADMSGERNPAALLTHSEAVAIREATTLSCRGAAEMFGVSRSLVSAIRCGHVWR